MLIVAKVQKCESVQEVSITEIDMPFQHCINKVDFITGHHCIKCCSDHDSNVIADPEYLWAFVPYEDVSSVNMSNCMPVDVVQVDNVDHISECFRNMCTDWFDVNSIKHKASVNECFTDLCFDKLNVETSKHDFLCQKKMYWKDHLHYGIKHNTDAFNYHDFDLYSVDMITEFVAEQGVSAIEMMTPQQDLIVFETVELFGRRGM